MTEYLKESINLDAPLTGDLILANLNANVQEVAAKFDFRNPIKPHVSAAQDLEQDIEACAKSLLAIGLDRGDKVGVYDATVNEWIVLYGAAQKVGVELVHIGREFSSEDTMLYLNKTKCRVLFASANARIFLKDLVAKFTDEKVIGLTTEFVVLFDENQNSTENNLITYQAFKNLAKYTSDWELNRIKKLAQ